MQMDVEVAHTFEDRLAVVARREKASREALLARAMRSIAGNVERGASEALLHQGQEATSFTANLEGVWPHFGVTFKGDPAGANAAFDAWCDAIVRPHNSQRILTASLNGSDGTHREYTNAQRRHDSR
jgi:hypothetical protein